MTYKYVDLFSGCGGLSLGVEHAGGQLVLAVEKSAMAAETFAFNLNPSIAHENWGDYLNFSTSKQIDAGLLVRPVSALLQESKKLKALRNIGIDAVVGGPPCQGFSLAGRRNQQDERNTLPWQFLEVVAELNPKIVVIENVVGMRHKFRGSEHSPFDALAIALCETGTGYVVQKIQANALHYGAAQSRPRLLLIALRADLAESLGIKPDPEIWESNFTDHLDPDIPMLVPLPTTRHSDQSTVRDALSDLIGSETSNFLSKLNSDFAFLPTRGLLYNNEKRNHAEKSKTRFALYHLVANFSLPHGLINHNSNELQEEDAIALLKDLQYPIHRADGRTLAKSAEELAKLFIEHKTHKQSQRVVTLDRPSPTILTSADDYIHPTEERVFSVRELARMQGFPDNFVFCAKATTGGLSRRHEVPQYSQVGNAVSPFLSKAIGALIGRVLR